MSKSNIPEVIMWGVYAVITGVCLMGMTVAWSNGPGYGLGFGVVAAVLGTALIGVFAGGIHKLFQKYNPMAFLENRKLLEKIMEGLILLGILGGMIFVRLQYSWNITEQDVYELLQINTMDVEVVSGHGGHDLYLSLVRLSFLVLGNRAFAPIVLQLVLMVCATFSLYFGVRKLAGRAASIVAIGFLGFAPYMIAQTCNLTSFVLFLFFFGIALMCIGDIRHNMSQADSLAERLVALLCYVTTGLLIGVCCYLDVSGVILLLIATGIICSGENDTEELLGKPVIVFISIVVFAVFMFWLIHGSFESILKQLAQQSRPCLSS